MERTNIKTMNKDLSFICVMRNESRVARVILDIMKPVCKEMYLGVQKSNDHTLKICREYTKNVFERQPEAPEYTKDFLMSKVKTKWAVWFDADEIPSYQLINYLLTTDFRSLMSYEAIRVPRINYVDGVYVEGKQKLDWGDKIDHQFMILRKDVRWNPTPERSIHIWPKVTNHFAINCPVYHHRTLAKIVSRTKDWDRINPEMKEQCNSYAYDVELAVKKYTKQ